MGSKDIDLDISDVTGTSESAIEISPDSTETNDCFRMDRYSVNLKPAQTGIFTSVSPSDYEIFSIDFSASFPISLHIEKEKPFAWKIHAFNLHGRHRPTGTLNYTIFSKKVIK